LKTVCNPEEFQTPALQRTQCGACVGGFLIYDFPAASVISSGARDLVPEFRFLLAALRLLEMTNSLARYRPWFYAAAIYNLIWGAINILFPNLLFDLLQMPRPNPVAFWQLAGMFVLVYAPAYFWAARFPEHYPHLVAIGLLGKILGPIGFVWSVATNQLPLAFGWTILTNDLIWWLPFGLYLREAARARGGWGALMRGG